LISQCFKKFKYIFLNNTFQALALCEEYSIKTNKEKMIYPTFIEIFGKMTPFQADQEFSKKRN